jgi:hypothetical protein
MTLLPQLEDELTRAAAAQPSIRRAGSRAAGALVAAVAALLLAAPTAQGDFAIAVSTPAAIEQAAGR